MIPKIIHQLWIGDQYQRPQAMMDTWKMNGFEYKLWTEKEVDEMQMVNRQVYDWYYERGIWHGASDIFRAEVLAQFGGVYIDADTERLEDWNDAPFLNADLFAAEANSAKGVPKGYKRISSSIIGAVPNHPVMLAYVKAQGEAKELMPPWSTIAGSLFSEMVRLHKTPDTLILPPHTFYPYDSKGNPAKTRGKVYARHDWMTTHKSYDN